MENTTAATAKRTEDENSLRGRECFSQCGVIGHNAAKQILENSIKTNRVSHAYIFEGAAGVGRLSLAKVFAEKIVGGSVGAHPDITIVTNELYNPSKKDARSISIDTIRAMKNDVYIRPYSAERKVYIIPNADNMQAVAKNGLLKVFEEPPEYCVIILTATNVNALMQTIRSRAQLIRLNPLEKGEVVRYIAEHTGADSKSAEAIAAMSGGSIGKALRLSEDGEAVELRSEVIGHMLAISGNGFVPLYDFIKFLKQNKASIQLVLDIMSDWCADVMRAKTGGEILNTDKAAELNRFCSRVTRHAALRFGELVTKYMLAINKNANYPIAVQCMATEYWEEIHGRSYRSAF